MIRDINIKPVLNGFIVGVGCQTVVFNDLTSLIRGITDYYTDPERTEKEFINRAINKTMDAPCAPAAECEAPRELRRNLAEAIPARR